MLGIPCYDDGMPYRDGERATARLVRFPRTQIALALVQLPLIVAAIVVAIMQRWTALGAVVAGYIVVTLVRWALTRVRIELEVLADGIALADGRSWKWDELAEAQSWFLRTRKGERFSIVTDTAGEPAVSLMKQRWVEHVLAKAREQLAAGNAVELGKLQLRANGIDRGDRVVPWDELAVTEKDGFTIVFTGIVHETYFDHDIPEGPVGRALLRELR